ncbi:hypothetical protein IAT38_000085 [Cryptococcus sp. DSM 104549]
MGNTSSTHATSASSSAPASEEQRPVAQPISAPSSSNRAGSSSSPHPSGSLTFHSGLTPPTSPPSPPPPSTPPLLPYAGHLSPQNPHCLSHPQAHDFSKSVVTKLIIDGQLAPFYRGLEDFEEDWTEDDIARVLSETRENDYEEGVANSYTERLKEERENAGGIGGVTKKIGINKSKDSRRALEKEEREKRERRAYLKAVECPICFLNYPPNINTSRCCQQPVCTECFVQIKRSEATITHLESDPACCPFCMETDFGVIYERPADPLSSLSSVALATSPAEGQSGFSQAFSVGSDADLAVGPGMNPKQKETVRRKSVNAKAKEVVTIDEIRPDWEQKLNAVKAAAARRASRRIVMRQVGDRLVPIGFTSSRAPGTADFSMSVPPSGDDSGSGSSPRRSGRRRESNRERELEELMIMEAMRLSLVDHEEHQRKQADERRDSLGTSPSGNAGISTAPTTSSPLATTSTTAAAPAPTATGVAASSGAPSSSSSRRHSGQNEHTGSSGAGGNGSGSGSGGKDKQSGTSKLLSKLNNVRARANSAASGKGVSFASGTAGGGGSGSGGSRSAGSSSSPAPSTSPIATTSASHHTAPAHPRTPSGGLSPTSPAPVAVAPVTTLASPGAGRASGAGVGSGGLLGESPEAVRSAGSPPHTGDAPGSGGFPRLSLDMPALQPQPRANHKSTASTSSTTAPTNATSASSAAPTAGGFSLANPLDASSTSPTNGTGFPGSTGLRRDLSAMSEETEGGLNRTNSTSGAGQSYAQLDSDEE